MLALPYGNLKRSAVLLCYRAEQPMKNQSVTDSGQISCHSKQQAASHAMLHKLSQFIMQQLPKVPRLSDAASALNMSCRTLQRELRCPDSSFRQLLADCRHTLAQQYLQDASLSLQQIAFQLGFEEQSSFQKAFKSWQGCSPGIFRQRRQMMAVSRCHPLSGFSRSVLQVNYGTN